ncbi:MAG: amidohydrolase family protein [Lentisphaerae bacterium]|jgi:uncharacterized protein|nr:amidohydrolase family protein [Lentisphaerota bacterium]MBT4814672.1 amidohydrolase family protein [Lentisphaerota bacterium]MBT5609468.1 amidohydrolase family protein [Lentisphaerota bacterium]MBT7061211.1 amidohydrolase family protein [Lentisphaerota bacterium]MBT7848670.1 amidohydrolase family protein [Lentisphaerota bacterium]
MAVVDIHEHVILERGFLLPNGYTITTAEELVAIMDRLGIDQMVALPLTSPETYHFVQSNEEVFHACDRFPDRFIKFCNVDPRITDNSPTHDFVPILEYYQGQGAKGVGEVTANLWWDDARVQQLLRACEAVGLPFLFHIATQEYNTYGLITERGLGGLERSLQRFPGLQFLCHSTAFWAEVGPMPAGENRGAYVKGRVLPGGKVPELLRAYPNMWGDLSAGSGYNAVSRDPEWGYDFIEEFQDRLLMGLDICQPWNDEASLIGFMRDAVETGKISQGAFEKVMGRNAEQLLELESDTTT